jgi:hypothetical protein
MACGEEGEGRHSVETQTRRTRKGEREEAITRAWAKEGAHTWDRKGGRLMSGPDGSGSESGWQMDLAWDLKFENNFQIVLNLICSKSGLSWAQNFEIKYWK